MRIEAADIGRVFGRQTRAYAEYRVFSSLARFAEGVREAAISLEPDGDGRGVICSVVVSLDAGAPVRVEARGRHAYDAINRAAYRLGSALQSRPEGRPLRQSV